MANNLQAQELEDDVVVLEQAGRTEYEKGTITLWEDVILHYQGVSLKSNYLQMNLDTEELLAKGSITFSIDRIHGIKSPVLEYNLRTKSGWIEAPIGYIKPLFFGSRQAYLSSQTITLKEGYFTTCNAPHPHYCLWADKIQLFPGDKVVVKNAFFKIGRVPIFYFPYYRKSLDERKSGFTLGAGQSSFEGKSMRLTYNASLTKNSSASFHLGYLQKRGIICGLEHNYQADNKLKGETYFYYIRERNDLKWDKRWKIESSHLRGTKRFNGLLHLEMMSDELVSRDYPSPGRPASGNQRLRNYITLTRLHLDSLLRIGAERRDVWEKNSFKSEQEAAPFVSRTTRLKRLKNLGWYYSLDTNLMAQKASPAQDYSSLADLNVNLVRRIILREGLVLCPGLRLGGEYRARGIGSSALIYTAALTLRQAMSGGVNLEAKYSLAGRLKDALTEHSLQIVGDMRLKHGLNARLKTGLDLQPKKGQPFKLNKQQLLPLLANLDLSMANGLTLSLKITYSIAQSSLKRFEYLGGFKQQRWQTEFSLISNQEYSDQEEIFELRHQLGYQLTPQSHIQLSCYYDLKHNKLKESSLILNQSLHCWQGQFVVLQRLDASDQVIEFRVGLKLK